MIEPSAAQRDIHEPPRISREALNDLRRVIDTALSLINDATLDRTGPNEEVR
jgi:hypothetical protein